MVLGAGLSGLAAAHASGGDLYEAEAEPGGVAASDTVDGFVFDRGIHILQTRNKKILDFLAGLGVEFIEHRRKAYIYTHGKYTAYPFQVNTASLPIALRARCVSDYLRRGRWPEPRNYREWMYRSIGREFAETFLIPYSRKFWGVDPAEMTFDWTGGRVPEPTTLQVLRGALWDRQTAIGTNATFRYPAGRWGYGTLAQRMAEALDGVLHTGWRAEAIDPARRVVRFANGEERPFSRLVSSLPLPALVRMVQGAPAEALQAANALRTNSIAVVNLGLGVPHPSEMHWVHVPEPQFSFFRLSFPSLFGPEVVPRGCSSISCEVAYAGESAPDADALIARVKSDLCRMRLLSADTPIRVAFVRLVPHGYCIYDHERRNALRRIDDWLRTTDIISTGRYGLWSYFWSDQAISAGLSAGRKACGEVARAAGALRPNARLLQGVGLQ